MGGELVGPEVFRRWQAVINNSRCVSRVTDIRQEYRSGFPYVVLEDFEKAENLLKEAQQIDLLTNFLLDINHTEPLESDSVKKPGPKETA